jgi:hypothetical protein
MPNDGLFSRVPQPPNVAGPSRGNDSGGIHLGTSTEEDIRRLACQYLQNPSAHVDKLRMRRSRSGGFKVMILLEIEDTF